MRKFIGILHKVILFFLIGLLIFVCYAKYIRKDNIVKIGKYAILIVLTKSMEPTIAEKEMILIKECENYHLKDIVTYQDEENFFITHRIMQIDEYSFMAKGDNNYIADESADLKNIEGKVVYHSKALGVFILYYLRPLIILYIGLMLLIYYLKEVKNVEKKEE